MRPPHHARGRPRWSWSWLLAVLLLPCAGHAESPAPFKSRYEVTLAGITVAHLQRELSYPAPGAYRFESRLESSGLANLLRKTWTEEHSEGVLDGDGIAPTTYLHTKVSGKKRRETRVEFQRTQGRIVQQIRDAVVEQPLEAGVLDKLSYQLALMRDLREDTRELRYRVADDGRIKDYVLAVAGTEQVTLGKREIATLRVIYAREGSSRRTTLWCAPELGNLPVKIEYLERDGSRLLATLRE